jgi:quercetin dioxygenase-like cupin family protein
VRNALLRYLGFAVSLGFSAALVSGAGAATSPTIVTPDKVHWTAGTGPAAGSQIAVLSGNPDKAGSEYAIRYKMPDGLQFAPHFHGGIENVTVISGTLLVGLGDKIDTKKMLALPAGSFVSIPPNVHHFAMAKGATFIQINSVGPRSMTPVKAKM